MIIDRQLIISVSLLLLCILSGCKSKTTSTDTGSQEDTTIKTNSLGMQFVWIPAGEYMMGSSFSIDEIEKRYGGITESFKSEFPRHEVIISKGFWMSQYETTQSQYESIMGENPSVFKSVDLHTYPVDSVTWANANEFCRRLSEKEGKEYTLPTEAQWEYACRAGTTTAYFFGDDSSKLVEFAWYDEHNLLFIDGPTNPVGQKKANAWSLYDIYGNVSEWCLDRYVSNYYSESPKEDPFNDSLAESESEVKMYVHRGGSWVHPDEHCRSTDRDYDFAGLTDESRGFRVIYLSENPD